MKFDTSIFDFTKKKRNSDINEKKITVEFNKLAEFYTNPVAIDIGDDDSHYIVKVLGYR